MHDEHTISMNDLVNGVHYLVDYYQFLEIEREADEGSIKSACRMKLRIYHPDKYAHLAPILQLQAEKLTTTIGEAERTLTNPILRAEYNKLLLEFKGPISNNGFPIYDPEYWSKLNRTPITDESVEEFKQTTLKQLSGYDPETTKLLERFAEGSDDEEIILALDRNLQSHDTFIAIEEAIRWEQLGASSKPEVAENAPRGYLECVRALLEEAEKEIPTQARLLLKDAQGGELKLLSPAGEDTTSQYLANPEQALAGITAHLTEQFDRTAEKIEALAEQREALAEKRLQLLCGKYIPPQDTLFPKLIVGIKFPRALSPYWLAFSLTDTVARADESVNREQMELLEDVEEAKKWIAAGWNIMFWVARDNLDIHDQMQTAITKHFDAYLDQQQTNTPT